MMELIPLLDAPQDGDTILYGWLAYLYRLKASGECCVFFYLAARGKPVLVRDVPDNTYRNSFTVVAPTHCNPRAS